MSSSLTDYDRTSLVQNRNELFQILVDWIRDVDYESEKAGCVPGMTIQQLLEWAVEEYRKNMELFALPIDEVIFHNLGIFRFIFERCSEIQDVIASLTQIQKDLGS